MISYRNSPIRQQAQAVDPRKIKAVIPNAHQYDNHDTESFEHQIVQVCRGQRSKWYFADNKLHNRITVEKVLAIRDLAARGETLRKIAAAVGVSKRSAETYRRLMVRHNLLADCACGRPNGHAGTCAPRYEAFHDVPPKVMCGCGREAFHRGWCSYRLAQSPKRQAVLERMHAKQRAGKSGDSPQV